jgi:hypothetical protein
VHRRDTRTVTLCREGHRTVVTLCMEGHRTVTGAFRLFPSSSMVSALVETSRLIDSSDPIPALMLPVG